MGGREQGPDLGSLGLSKELGFYCNGNGSLWRAVCKGMMRSSCMNRWGEMDAGASDGVDPMADLPREVHLGTLTQPSSFSKCATSSGLPSWIHTLCHLPQCPPLSPESPSRVHSE